MAIVTTHQRTCRLIPAQSSKGVPQLVISNGVTRTYFVRKETLDRGDAYTLWRSDETDPAEEVRYVVWFWRSSSKTMCDCPDAQYRGQNRPCKHVAALTALRARGLI